MSLPSLAGIFDGAMRVRLELSEHECQAGRMVLAIREEGEERYAVEIRDFLDTIDINQEIQNLKYTKQ